MEEKLSSGRPWTIDEEEACFIVNDKNGQALAYNCVERARPIARL